MNCSVFLFLYLLLSPYSARLCAPWALSAYVCTRRIKVLLLMLLLLLSTNAMDIDRDAADNIISIYKE